MTDNFLAKNRKLYEYHSLDSNDIDTKENSKYNKIVKQSYTKGIRIWSDFIEFYRDTFNTDSFIKKLFCLMLFVFFIEYMAVRSCV